ncbi:multiple epidermal growth factor-like domains 10 [Elysia marginata]|uniref:Multiple epidermal growth factor-like domains 10 n=1 Tax=Elysia marginata TaxID=1093978 RepID=A0AAV4IJB0_9GAST|nr:multiple epidermal growth factor-like domains 10 [Elysia marginata]
MNHLTVYDITIWALFLKKYFINSTAYRKCYTDGWFGTNCQYQCHCAGSTPYDKVDGSCSSGCQSGWFGPACQYAYVEYGAFTVGGRVEMKWLTDMNDLTCNPGGQTSLKVTLKHKIPLTWIRIVVRDAALLKNIRFGYEIEGKNNITPCSNSEKAMVDDTTLDIACTSRWSVKHIHVSGPGTADMCSLYISRGRNVALKQKAAQSTTQSAGWFQRNSKIWQASNAVDGKLDIPDDEPSQKATCTHTNGNDRGWWTVSFTKPVNVYQFLIYNRRDPSRKDCCEERLKGFKLTVQGEKIGKTLFQYKDKRESPKHIYNVVPPEIIRSVSQVKIQVDTYRKTILTLCEVEVFGDIPCRADNFGLACEHQCNCVNKTRCFDHSGGCPAGCAPGYTGEDCYATCPTGKYGSSCLKTCNNTCAGPDNACDHIDGTCINGCEDGYVGDMCERPCSVGKYGPSCSKTCNTNCAGSDNDCDHINGTCTNGCKDGYRSNMCDKPCSTGKYGSRCSQTCNTNCAGLDDACDHIDGTCINGCDDGFLGEMCNMTCRTGTYGSNCSQTCNTNCAGLNDSCHNIHGTCINGCGDGYTGRKCDRTCPSGKYGPRCSHNCNINCAGRDNVCDHIDGTCNNGCDDGFIGNTCDTPCPAGTYGSTCSQTCNTNCAGSDDACDHINGTCTNGCEDGYVGDICDRPCPRGNYGFKCSQTCSFNCAGSDDACDHIDGTCTNGCENGYRGHMCDGMGDIAKKTMRTQKLNVIKKMAVNIESITSTTVDDILRLEKSS